jgi:glycosyltransferase involved in cell wall biosynthesis
MNKLLIFIPSIENGGVEKNLFIVTNYLKKNGIEIEILTCNRNYSKRFNNGIKFIGPKSEFWFNKSRVAKYIYCLIALFFNLIFRKNKPLLFAFQANIYAIIIAKILNTKIITRSNSAPAGWSTNSLKLFLYKFLINLADGVMVNSLEFKKSFEKKFNIKVQCIYNPFDKNFVRKKKLFKIRNEIFKKDFLNIVCVGRLTDQKDHITLLKSINLLKSNFKIKLFLIGNGPLFNLLKNFIINNKLQKKVKLLGYKKNPYPYISKSDIIILTSKFEGLPNILLEAQYLKKYIISTDCPTGPNEILLNGKAGDLIKVGDYKKITNLILNYSKQKNMIKKKIIFGYNNFDRFDYKINCKKYLDFVNKNF